MRPRHALACALLAWLIAAPAAAQQVKPYFLIVFDTSGSMDDAVPANSCGFPATKIGAAKCVLNKLVNATGDAEFGLMQFAKGSSNTNCNGGSCTPTAGSAWLRVPIQTNSSAAITHLTDNAGTAPADELCAGGNTPLGGSLVAAKNYFEGTLGSSTAPTSNDAEYITSCRPLGVILMTDGVECCDQCTSGDALYNTGCPGPASDITAAGLGLCPSGSNACATYGGCGNASNLDAFESAPQKAWLMRTNSTVPRMGGSTGKQIKTYVIGFGNAFAATGDDRLERIAIGGGTDNSSDGPGNLHAFYANNEAALSSAFNQIIADAQPPTEVCNNADDDCDMKIDEGIPKFCDKPNGVDDKTLCDEPPESKCDGEDDDCDGLIDEGVLNACGQCGKEPKEICDGVDNDCDGNIDEMTDGGECGTDVGHCEKGTLRCIGGEEQCTGGVQPSDELCNCKDDDCDGNIDEDVDGTLCAGSACVSCSCIQRCEPGEEFMPVCPDKLTADIQPNGECLCVEDNCDPRKCREQTLKRDDKVACAPDRDDVATCLCRAGECGARCDGVACPDSETCDERSGTCVENNCRGLGCADGQLCDPMTTECADDPCADAKCKTDEVCRDGDCEPSCAKVTCMSGQRCESGRCIANPCSHAACEAGEVCNPDNGKCIKNPCANVACAKGLLCTVPSGMCERNPCWNVHCPSDQTCTRGECLMKDKTGETPSNIGDKPSGDRGDGDDPNQRLLASGGGGCACRVTPGTPAGGTSAAFAGMLTFGLALAFMRRRLRFFRSRRQLVTFGALLALAVLLAATGCNVEPFCVDCKDAGKAATGTGGSGGHVGEGDAQVDGGNFVVDGGGTGGNSAPGDAGPDGSMLPPTCTEKKPEVCNGKDDDCDFIVDEQTTAQTNDCDQHGICAGTEPVCVNGKFTCRYPDEREDQETKCDGKDNDCDGRVDETFKDLGTDCDVGTGACLVTGKQVCNDGGNGLRCEVDKTIDPGDEVCDGIDNDCDGDIDEPKSKPGTAPSYVHDDVVQVSNSLWIYEYEASRPDAKDNKAGIITTRACSRKQVLPWTGLTYSEAKTACSAADMEVCAVADWVNACDGSDPCPWSLNGGSCPKGSGTDADGYPTDSSPSNKNACNGHDLIAQPGAADNDALAPTGTYPSCYSSLMNNDKAFDMSGNAKEWTTGPNSPDENPLRGGGYNNLPGGLRCDFDFSVAGDDVRLPNVGFRCCSDTNPN